MLKYRVISAIIGIIVLLTMIHLGGIYWQALFLLIGIIGLYEYYQMMKNKGLKVLALPGFMFFLVLFFSPLLSRYFLGLIWLVVLVVIISLVRKYPLFDINDLSFSILGAFYLGFLLSFAIRMVDFNNAFVVMLIAFILTWSSDIGSYVFGVTWGKNKMAPELSPNKTWEGSMGGIILAIVAAAVFFRLGGIPHIGFAYAVLLGITGSMVAQLGDLFMSGVKRYFGVKDSGNIIPGHGGVLDRFDGFLLVLPLVYYFFTLVA